MLKTPKNLLPQRRSEANMANYSTMLLSLLCTALITSASTATNNINPSKSRALIVATEEMMKANYFSFVMLINMISTPPPDQRIEGNVTFLMPNDRMLSRAMVAQDSVFDFLLRHSIPSPLLLDHLERIPSGSTIPSSKPEYMLSVYNKGRKSYFLNNVRLISPNICTAGSSIRCHGIDGLLTVTHNNNTNNPPPPTSCSSTISPTPPGATALAPPPIASPLPGRKNGGSTKSGSCHGCHSLSLSHGTSLVLSIVSILAL